MVTLGQLRKEENDKKRKRKGAPQRKRLHVLQNPNKLAFRGWEDEPDMWTMATCESFIEWCHIDKKFPLSRHHFHRRTNKANLKFCECPNFKQRCIEVYQVLYAMPCVERNEVPLFLARGVYAEVALGKRVDWTTVKEGRHVTQPSTSDIPTGILRFPDAPNGGMAVTRSITKAMEEAAYHSATSEEDDDSDGSRPRKAVRQVQQSLPPTSVVIDADHRRNLPGRVPEIGGSRPAIASNHPPVVEPHGTCILPVEELDTSSDLKALLKSKDDVIARLQADLEKTRAMYEEKVKERNQLSVEYARMREKMQELSHARNIRGDVEKSDMADVDRVVFNLTEDLAFGEMSPQRPTLCRPVKAQPSVVNMSGLEREEDVRCDSQDSLSLPLFPRIRNPSFMSSDGYNSLLKEKQQLQARLEQLCATYYHWKVACILSVDRGRQVAAELEKIDKNFTSGAGRRTFGMTSWPSVDTLFDNLPMMDIKMQDDTSSEVVDWSKAGWNFKHHMSAHVDVASRTLLWPNPPQFVLDHSTCPICLNPFGPEGGWALGSCVHMYHPQCLLLHCLTQSRCAICKAPFHERFYEMFNLRTYMPPSWEHNAETTDEVRFWGKDLIWSWRRGEHDLEKSTPGSQLNWETDPNEILRVAPILAGQGPQHEGNRMFFFQCLGGYFDLSSNTFKWGPHPMGHRWNQYGKRVTDGEGRASMEDLEECQYAESTWGPRYQSQALDYLLDVHSPLTRRTLQDLKDSRVLDLILNADGPFNRTRAKRKLLVGECSNPQPSE